MRGGSGTVPAGAENHNVAFSPDHSKGPDQRIVQQLAPPFLPHVNRQKEKALEQHAPTFPTIDTPLSMQSTLFHSVDIRGRRHAETKGAQAGPNALLLYNLYRR